MQVNLHMMGWWRAERWVWKDSDRAVSFFGYKKEVNEQKGGCFALIHGGRGGEGKCIIWPVRTYNYCNQSKNEGRKALKVQHVGHVHFFIEWNELKLEVFL